MVAVFIGTVTAILVVGGGACHRRRPHDGTCAAHIDCDPGYDCLARRCTRRAPLPGTTPGAPVAPIVVPTSPRPDSPAQPSEQPAPSVPRTPAPRPSVSPPPLDNQATPPSPDLPMWKARLKNS